ncbi:MAG: aspartate ammonia-lyase [Chlorobi bacterium]|nr:aspartate ammonia-lyase [Chlorobiota bacterium]
MRKEKDHIGEKEIPQKALYGIHSLRARENFPDNTAFHIEWYKAAGMVKQACYITYRKFRYAVEEKYDTSKIPHNFINKEYINALEKAAAEVSEGKYFDQFIVPAVQGGAGTSINMNINEIIANVALIKTGNKPGEYHLIDPIEQANVFQSTNDVIPTALKIASMKLLEELEEEINRLRKSIESIESETRNIIRQGYTQMQEAVPSSYDKLFSSFNNALSRDWWRISKCFERIKEVNLGGGAIGTGLAIPRFFILQVTNELQRLTNLPVTRGENLSDTTSNLDALVEVHAILNAHAANIEKIASDIRLLGSDLFKNRNLKLMPKQVGSSIMPGKINPVISEFAISAAHKVYANNQLITHLAGLGTLELNAYLPLIGHALIDSLKILTAANKTLTNNLFDGLKIKNPDSSYKNVLKSPSVVTALIPYIGYHKASEISRLMNSENIDVFEANATLGIIPEKKIKKILSPEALLKLGYSIDDIIN